MTKATPVPGLDPSEPFHAAADDVLAVRIADLWEFERIVAQPGEVKELHNMRIAAKRLRYCMEFFSVCLGPDVEEQLTRFKQLQDYLGDIHDCDTWAVLLVEQLAASGVTLAEALLELNAGDGTMLAAARELGNSVQGEEAAAMLAILVDILERRQRIYSEFHDFWDAMAVRGLRNELTALAGLPGPDAE